MNAVYDLVQRFFSLNRRASDWLAQRLPHTQPSPWAVYDEAALAAGAKAEPGIVVDAGGGRACPLGARLRAEGHTVVAVDVAPEELALNKDVSETRVADIQRGLPFADGEAGIVLSCTVMEHLEDVDAFVGHAARVLRPGGYTVHLLPCRYAVFAIPGRLVPFSIGVRIAHFLRPMSKGIVEFPVYYDRCYPTAIEDSLRAHGFENVDCRVSYYQAEWFDGIFPLYALVAGYELVVRALGMRNLCAYLVVTARKKDEAQERHLAA